MNASRVTPICMSCQRRAALAGRRLSGALRVHSSRQHIRRSSLLSKHIGEEVDLEESFQVLRSLIETSHERVQMLKRLSRPITTNSPPPNHHVNKALAPVLPEAKAGPIPLDVFRKRLREAPENNPRLARLALREQLLRCTTPKDMLHVLTIAFGQSELTRAVNSTKRPDVAKLLVSLETNMTRAFYRCRANASDQAVLRTIMQYIGRFELAKLPMRIGFYRLALKFAARSRDADKMRRCLVKYKRQASFMPEHLFRAICAKCSVGWRGLGTIRNGRWQPADIHQVLLGFDVEAHLPVEQCCHLDQFMDRTEWTFLHGWIAALALTKSEDAMLREWELWKQHPLRTQPKQLREIAGCMDSKIRGDAWFVEQTAASGNQRLAWQILKESSCRFRDLKERVKVNLIESAHFAGALASEVNSTLLDEFGHHLLPSGQPVSSLCILDDVDAGGYAVFSERTAIALCHHLRENSPWTSLGELTAGDTPAAVSEARALHAAEVDDASSDTHNDNAKT